MAKSPQQQTRRQGLWALIENPKRRAILSWIGSGVAVAAAGLWAVVTFAFPEKRAAPAPTVTCAQQGSIAAGRDASHNTITVTAAGTSNSMGSVACGDAAKK